MATFDNRYNASIIGGSSVFSESYGNFLTVFILSLFLYTSLKTRLKSFIHRVLSQ